MYQTCLVMTYADARSQSGGSCVKHCRREHSVNTHALNIVVDYVLFRGQHCLLYSYWWIQRRGPGVGMASFTLTVRSRGGAQGSAWPPLLLLVDPEEGPRGRHGLLYSYWWIQRWGPGVDMASFTLTGGSRGGAQGSAWPPLLLLSDPEEGPRGQHGLLYSYWPIQRRGPGVGIASFTLTGGSRGGAQGSAWPPLLLLADPEEGPRGRHGLLYSYWRIQRRGPGVGMASFTLTGGSRGGAQGSAWPPLLLLADPGEGPRGRHGLLYSS